MSLPKQRLTASQVEVHPSLVISSNFRAPRTLYFIALFDKYSIAVFCTKKQRSWPRAESRKGDSWVTDILKLREHTPRVKTNSHSCKPTST